MKTGYLHNRLAALFASWIETCDKSSELYNLVHVFLTSVLPREECPEAQDLPKDKDKAAACFSLYSEKLSLLLASDVENPALGALEKRFGLGQLDRGLLEFFYLYLSFAPLEAYFDKLPEWEMIDRLRAYCSACERDVVSALQVDGLLMRSGIGTNDGHALRMTRHGVTFGLSGAILAFIETNGARPLSSFLLEQWEGEALPLSSFDLPSATIAAARASLTATRGKAVLFLTGSPGTGKTEFSRSISCASGLVPYKVKRDSSSGKRSFSDLLLAARLVDPAGEVLVIDEADDLLMLDPGLFTSPRGDLVVLPSFSDHSSH